VYSGSRQVLTAEQVRKRASGKVWRETATTEMPLCFADDFLSVFVVAQPYEFGVAECAVPRPFVEGDLRDELRL
jgi:hypothetical protein